MKNWIAGARPRTLPAAVAPVIVGAGVAAPKFNLLNATLTLLVALALQVGVNYANDYSDGVRGTDDERVGPLRLVASGLASATSVKRAAFLAFFIAAVAGSVVALRTSLWLILVGLLAIIAAWQYTGGKNPYGYLGLGELFVFLFFGLVAVVGTAYVLAGEITLLAWVSAIPVGALACALLVINNLRDRANDAIVNKMTMAVRLGDRNSRALFIVLMLTPFVFAVAAIPMRPWSWLAIAALPLAIYTSRYVAAGAMGVELIRGLKLTGQVQLLFALFFTLGLTLSA